MGFLITAMDGTELFHNCYFLLLARQKFIKFIAIINLINKFNNNLLLNLFIKIFIMC